MIQFNLTALNMVEAKLPPCKVAELRTARSYVVSSRLQTSFFVRGRRQGRQPLNPAMPSGGGC